MTKLLEKVLARLAKLPDEEQDAFAALLLGEMESEGRWQESFAASQDVLEVLADEAVAEHKAGRTSPLVFDTPNKQG